MLFFLFLIYLIIYLHINLPASGQAAVSGVVPSPPRYEYDVRAFSFHRALGSAFPLLVDFHRMLLTHALALSASQFVHKKKSLRIYTSMNSGGLELTQLTSSVEEAWSHHLERRHNAFVAVSVDVRCCNNVV